MASLVACFLLLGNVEAWSTPRWEPTYEMWRSTAFMPCNDSGFFDPAYAAKWGIADFDWSNGKADWANQKPMDCQERLARQAEKIKAINNKTRVFVYRNLVKALPWYSDVREKIANPAYSGWFLRFKDGVNGSYHVPPCTHGKCSGFYHDQDQTPKHPHGDGSCVDECDCGSVPCGEYLWDHRNDTLPKWFVDEFVMGHTGLGDPNVDGFFFDDGWQDTPAPRASWWPKEGFCDADRIGGASEEYPNCTVDMGLTQQDTTTITAKWKNTISKVRDAVLDGGGFVWQMFHIVSGAPTKGDKCAAFFRTACKPNSTEHSSALLLTFTGKEQMIAPEQDLASFLLVRGPYAWIGHSWIGCTGGKSASAKYPRPAALDVDYGVPNGSCAETAEGSGIFHRSWSKAEVTLDCNSWQASIVRASSAVVI